MRLLRRGRDSPLGADCCRARRWRRAIHGQCVKVYCGWIRALRVAGFRAERAAIAWHMDLRMLKRYYHPRATDLAMKLA